MPGSGAINIGNSGFHLFPSLATVVMPLGFQVVPGLDLKSFDIFLKTWSRCASGQIATSTGSFLSRKCLTGDFLSLEIFFWFPLLIALSGQFLLNDQYGRRDASYI
ncbi:PREDICTED: Cyclin-dependent [Prunus dulcis]|uniref:PREDICTED: Cyclin-dependent n=1 Tax=Prunus dulcis TaxID=3755 RepID=A0A5E4EQ40_PRUDU|nr:PREDICTED: Cyclin-dependent [Prunus dulcis]